MPPPRKWTDEEHEVEVLYLMMAQWFEPDNYIERLRREHLKKIRQQEQEVLACVEALDAIYRKGITFVNIPLNVLSRSFKSNPSGLKFFDYPTGTKKSDLK